MAPTAATWPSAAGLIAEHHGCRFDERLPLYGWQEDIDFSRQCRPASAASSVATALARRAHGFAKSGRQSGLRFGYSQVANMVYLHRKGSVSARFAYALMGRNVAANVLKLLRPEPHIDRFGRSCAATSWHCFDLLRGRSAPSGS